MIRSSSIQLLRFHFSFFLMPVFLFALANTEKINWPSALAAFLIFHFLVYPASNGYNSFMDRDTESIGGIKSPKQPTKQLFFITTAMDLMAIGMSAFISFWFLAGVFLYIAVSRAYSFRGIRLKKYPVTGFIIVMIFQGGLVFWLTMHAASEENLINVPVSGIIAASLLVGGFYPITQIYQHKQDGADGVVTISMVAGYNGTFLLCIAIYTLAMMVLGTYMYHSGRLENFLIMQLILTPVLVFFLWWFIQVKKDYKNANYQRTMQMNILASICTNAAFIFDLITNKIG